MDSRQNEINPVFTKAILALLLILNHSVMVGAMEAEEIPDEAHPYGQTFKHEHLHHHAHQHDDHDIAALTDLELSDQETHTAVPEHHNDQEPHHEHGVHVHLNMDVPQTVHLDLQRRGSEALTSYQRVHQSQTWSPPVPPPNR